MKMGLVYPSETLRILKEKEIHLHGKSLARFLVLEANGEFTAKGI
jgi:hypothetical protein